MNVLLALLWSMLKIGCFAFGGGYAIIALLEGEFITKRKWIEHDEFMDVVAIAESTPGPIAINVATYVGYKLKGFLGATIATVGICAPSFVIMYVVSLFYEQFMEITVIAAAFKGIQICVVVRALFTPWLNTMTMRCWRSWAPRICVCRFSMR